MLTGKPPFAGTSGADLIRQHVLTPAADVRHSRPNVPTMLAGTVMRCLRKEREKRWQTAGELRSALAAAAVLPESSRARTSVFKMTSQVQRHRYPLIVLVLLAVASTAWVVIRNRTPPPPVAPPAEITTVVTPADPVDSLLVASRGAAEYARQRAATAGAQCWNVRYVDRVSMFARSSA